jgi:hypothetical protein
MTCRGILMEHLKMFTLFGDESVWLDNGKDTFTISNGYNYPVIILITNGGHDWYIWQIMRNNERECIGTAPREWWDE